jgi:hypothetical protein
MNLFGRKLDAGEQRVVDNIRDYGCQVQFVFDPNGKLPDSSYSIGFPVSVGQPEVIVLGLPRELMHSMVNEVRRQCAAGLILRDGTVVSGLLEGFDCVLRHVISTEAIREHFGWAIWYHRSQRNEEMREVYQIVWPSAQQGLFPWEPDCHPDVIALQPALYETRLNS